MSTRTVQIGEIGTDYIERKSIAQLKAARITFVTRYVKPGHSAYELFSPERDELLNGGIAITIVFETNVNAINGGAKQGQIDGYLAALDCAALKYPYVCAILAAVDTDAWSKNVTLCNAYLRAFYAASNPYGNGLYGDTEAFKLVRDFNPLWCKPNADGWDEDPSLRPLCHIWQGHEDKAKGWDYPNRVQHPFLAWTGLGPDTTPQAAIGPIVGPNSTGALVVAVQYFLLTIANQQIDVTGEWDSPTADAWHIFVVWMDAARPGSVSTGGTVTGNDWNVIAYLSKSWEGLYSHGYPRP